MGKGWHGTCCAAIECVFLFHFTQTRYLLKLAVVVEGGAYKQLVWPRPFANRVRLQPWSRHDRSGMQQLNS